MREALRAGIAVFNDGHYHAAHDAWEDRWLDLERGTDDERLLHGLIQFTAAVYHARNRNWEGTVGLATSAIEYLAALPDAYRGIDVAATRRALAALGSDPEVIERRSPPRLSHDGDRLELADLNFDETIVAARVVAEEFGYDEGTLEGAIDFARRDLGAGREDGRFVSLLFDFVREDDARGVVWQRLEGHVEKRRAREGDVEGLF